MALFENQKKTEKTVFFQSERPSSDKTLSELHVHCKFLLTRVHYRAWCKEYCKDFVAALKMFVVWFRWHWKQE